MTPTGLRYAVVVPTVGRPSVGALVDGLLRQDGPLPDEVVLVDDRPPGTAGPLPRPEPPPGRTPVPVRVLRGWGHGPAAARNLGWRVTTAEWVAFLDDDVVLPDGWCAALAADLEGLDPAVGGSQGRIHVPRPAGRRPTDWERATAGLETAHWATADMAYRRAALLAVDGFDERFPRAYREDADLAVRVRRAGWLLVRGDRVVHHPVRTADRSVSVRVQRGNADDALMRRLHGPRWREVAETGHGRLPWHVATTAAIGSTVAAAAAAVASAPTDPTGRSAVLRRLALAGATASVALVGDLARRRIVPGPRTAAEVATMAWTSAAIPPVAVWHRARGWWRHRAASPWPPRPRAVLLDRDGTLVHDVPYNGDPDAVAPVDGAREALDRLRSAGLRLGVVSNQSGVGRGLLRPEQVDAVNAAVERAVGPVQTWQVCPHVPEDGCACRKPGPGLVHAAASALGVGAEECVVVGDIGADVEAARAAGARSVLVPTATTRAEEVAAAPVVAPDLPRAVDLVLGWCRG
ncbi:HAD-IIIA family hydrolase [Fodinibacter luteus]|uniref:D,D-heptose 1,7-bisphosphate phosphatase n=1 Tax=Fodinibacter luteus TaxID=552064 RepID=A0ABP8KE30_9MICO